MQTTTRLATYSCLYCTTVFRSFDNRCPKCSAIVPEPFYPPQDRCTCGHDEDDHRLGVYGCNHVCPCFHFTPGGRISQRQILLDVAAISSGCMASLTGKTLYTELDAIQLDWWNWVEAQMATAFQFEHWKDAWAKYQEANRVR